MEIYLSVPDTTHKDSVLACKKEFEKYDGKVHIPGSSRLMDAKNYTAWLADVAASENLRQPKGKVCATQYIALRKNDDRLVGFIQLRHSLNKELLSDGGHIGYSIRPTERRKGYASEMLKLCLKEARELGLSSVLITCDVDNIASETVIRKAGGVLENSITTNQGLMKKRFWIDLE